jgi:predicted RNA binding protein YcfA (HicA-like mRNA interferase family)
MRRCEMVGYGNDQAELLRRLLGGRPDANIRFGDLCNLLKSLGFEERTRGSHHVYVKQGVEDMVNLQREGSKASRTRFGR